MGRTLRVCVFLAGMCVLCRVYVVRCVPAASCMHVLTILVIVIKAKGNQHMDNMPESLL